METLKSKTNASLSSFLLLLLLFVLLFSVAVVVVVVGGRSPSSRSVAVVKELNFTFLRKVFAGSFICCSRCLPRCRSKDDAFDGKDFVASSSESSNAAEAKALDMC